MAWPTADELKQRLDITSSDWDDHMDRLVASGIRWVKVKVGDWNEDTDAPDDTLAQAALERAVEQATTGDSPAGVSVPRKSESLLYGYRRRFGIG
jgi:hypothetical protein